MKDAGHRNRMPFGKQHHNCRLTLEQIEAIINSSGTQQSIADAFGICREYVRDLRNGKKRRKEHRIAPQG